MLRYPTVALFVIAIPVILMLLFVYVFGGTLGAGLGGIDGGRHEYANYWCRGSWCSPSPVAVREPRFRSRWT